MAELTEIIENDDLKWEIESATNIGNNPDRATIEQLLTDAGKTLPLENSVTFYLTDSNDHRMQVRYSKERDDYSYTGMSIASS